MRIKNVLSLFDGISCGQLALVRAGIKYDKYFAVEIEPNSIEITQRHFPATIHLGDITKLTAYKLKRLGLIGPVGGNA